MCKIVVKSQDEVYVSCNSENRIITTLPQFTVTVPWKIRLISPLYPTESLNPIPGPTISVIYLKIELGNC